MAAGGGGEVSILALDPGTTQTGWVVYADGAVQMSGTDDNAAVLGIVKAWAGDVLAIEAVASYGMAVGREVFETCVWIGRFQQAWREPDAVRLIYRKQVKEHLCGTLKAKDANIRRALLDLVGPQGTKKAPGPTHGVKTHAWSALAVAVTAAAG